MLVALRYKLRMFGVPTDGPANIFCDNNGVVEYDDTRIYACEETQCDQLSIIRVGKEDGMTNLADLFTKVLTADRRRALCRNIMY